MPKSRAFIEHALIGSLFVVVPIAALMLSFCWMDELVTKQFQPVSGVLIETRGFPGPAADPLTIVLILAIGFLVGTQVTTSFGKWAQHRFDDTIVRLDTE